MLQSEVCHEFNKYRCALPGTFGSAEIAVIYYLNLSFLYQHLLEGKKKNPTQNNEKKDSTCKHYCSALFTTWTHNIRTDIAENSTLVSAPNSNSSNSELSSCFIFHECYFPQKLQAHYNKKGKGVLELRGTSHLFPSQH